MTAILLWRSAFWFWRARRRKRASDRLVGRASALAGTAEQLRDAARAAERRGSELWFRAYEGQKARRDEAGDDQAPPWWLAVGIVVIAWVAAMMLLSGVVEAVAWVRR